MVQNATIALQGSLLVTACRANGYASAPREALRARNLSQSPKHLAAFSGTLRHPVLVVVPVCHG